MKRKKRQTIFLAGVLLLVLIAIGVLWYIAANRESFTTDYTANERNDVITYGGKDYEYNEHLSNFIFVGVDTTEPITEYDVQEDVGRADALFLVSLNRVDKTVRVLAIPRDTVTNVHVYSSDGTDMGMAEDHINMQYIFGDGKHTSGQLMKEVVSNLLHGIPIQGYCSMNMDGIPVAAGLVDGVQVVLPDDSMSQVDPSYVKGATVVVTEENAESFVRYRDTEVSQSAMNRMNRQKAFMEGFVTRAKEVAEEDTGFVATMYDEMESYMVTNIGTDMFAKLLQADYATDAGIQDIPGESVAGEDFDEYHVDDDLLYELVLEMFYQEVQEDK